MMRSRMLMLSLALVCGLATGCRNQLFIAEKDLNSVTLLPAGVEERPLDAIVPQLGHAPTPPDVNQPDRPPRHMTLQEAIAIAIENGTAFSRTPAQDPGNAVDDTLFSAPSALSSQSDYIRVLALNPAISRAAIENQLARFDAQWITSMNWTTTDNLQQGLQSFNNGSAAAFATSFVKALPTGGTANISFLTDYRLLTNPPTGTFGVLNPQYTSRLIFGIDHPLWKDYGTEINALLPRHPGNSPFSPIPPTHAGSFAGQLNQLSPFGAAPEGILVARVRYEQQKAEFERQLNGMVLNVEDKYWRLYQAYGALYSFEEVMRIAHRAWMVNQAKFKVGVIGPANFFPILGQFHEFRGERLAALANVIEQERGLRRTLGLPLEDGTRIVPITPPTLANYQPNYQDAIRNTLLNRPELALVRENLRVAHYQLLVQKNSLKPDLRGAAQYSPVGFGNRLDGAGTFIDGTETPRTTNAYRSLATDHFNDWSIGLILNVPLGYRAEMANVRAARLSLAQAYYFLKDQEVRATSITTRQVQELAKWHHLIEMRREERVAYAQAVEARFKEFAAGKTTVADFLLEAQRRLATAQVKEYEAIANYNVTLARFEWAKGTILQNNNVYMSEGPLPEFVQKRAVEHERERTKAHLLRHRPLPVLHPAELVQVGAEMKCGDPGLVNLPIPEGMTVPPEAMKMPAPGEWGNLPLPGGAANGGAAPRPTTLKQTGAARSPVEINLDAAQPAVNFEPSPRPAARIVPANAAVTMPPPELTNTPTPPGR